MTTAYRRVRNPGPIETYGVERGAEVTTYSSMLAARAARGSHADGDYILVAPTAADDDELSMVYRYDATNEFFIPPWWYAQASKFKVLAFEGSETVTDLVNLGYTVTQTGGGTVTTDGTKITFDASAAAADRAFVFRNESGLSGVQAHLYAQGWLRGVVDPTTNGENSCIRLLNRVYRIGPQMRRLSIPKDAIYAGNGTSTFVVTKLTGLLASTERFIECELFGDMEANGVANFRMIVNQGLTWGQVKEGDLGSLSASAPQGLVGAAASGQGKLEARELIVYAIDRV